MRRQQLELKGAAIAFSALGCYWGIWAVMIANVQNTFSLSDGKIGILMSISIATAGGTSAFSGHRAQKFGTKRLMIISLVGWALFMAGAGASRTWWEFGIFYCLASMAGGCVDAVMNASASIALAPTPGSLVRFHSLFNGGALVGAGAAGIAIAQGISWRWLWPSLGVIVMGVALYLILEKQQVSNSKYQVQDLIQDEKPKGPLTHLRDDGLLIFLVIFSLAEITEGGVDTWGVLYLRTHLASGILVGAGAYVLGQSMAVITRGFGGPSLGRLRARSALIVGASVAGGGILLESLSSSSHVILAGIGLAAGAGGASLFWPLVMSQATMASSQATSAIGSFTAAGYIGWVAGAPLVGWVSDRFGPARGLQVLAGLALLVVVISIVRKK